MNIKLPLASSHRRLIWIVLDSVGIGAAPDAALYGAADVVSNTLAHVAESVGGLSLPNLQKLGLGCIAPIMGVDCCQPVGAYGRMRPQSAGKDTTNGHWEFVGIVLQEQLPVYPNGFPREIIEPFERYVGTPILCNRPASGTEVILQYGPLHEQTGQPIVYTSADSVFQVAAHERIVAVETLYDWCQYARELLCGRHAVGRVIARPFVGQPGQYQRTDRRRDYAVVYGHTVLNSLQAAGWPVCGIGKISDIYSGSGISTAIHTAGNNDGMVQLLQQMDVQDRGLIFLNLVDFDSLYGHRNDAAGFADALESFDVLLGTLLSRLRDTDALLITADHGCDPTAPGTDHTREWVPMLGFHAKRLHPTPLGDRATFADAGATVAEFFSVTPTATGNSFLPALFF